MMWMNRTIDMTSLPRRDEERIGDVAAGEAEDDDAARGHPVGHPDRAPARRRGGRARRAGRSRGRGAPRRRRRRGAASGAGTAPSPDSPPPRADAPGLRSSDGSPAWTRMSTGPVARGSKAWTAQAGQGLNEWTTRRTSSGRVGSASGVPGQRRLERAGRPEPVPRARGSTSSRRRPGSARRPCWRCPPSARRDPRGPSPSGPAVGAVRPRLGVPARDVGDDDVAGREAGLELPDPAVRRAGSRAWASTARASVRPSTLGSTSSADAERRTGARRAASSARRARPRGRRGPARGGPSPSAWPS